MSRAADLAALTRLPVAAAFALPTLAGWWVAGGQGGPRTAELYLAALLLASGGAALNQVQEHRTDARMARTRARPIPAGRIRAGTAGLLAAALLLAALAWLALRFGLRPALLALLATILYNGIYTPAKRRTALAAAPGALAGALVPALGWTAAGAPADPRLAALCLYFWMWQGPHFWLLSALHGEDAARAGLASPVRRFARAQLARIAAVWLAATAAAGLLLPLYGVFSSPAALAALALLSLVPLSTAIGLARAAASPGDAPFATALTRTNFACPAVALLPALERFAG